MTTDTNAAPLWVPSLERINSSEMRRFMALAASRGYLSSTDADSFPALWRWSVDDRGSFWKLLLEFSQMIYEGSAERVGVGLNKMQPPDPVDGPYWFPDLKLNFAENLLSANASSAIVAWNEEGFAERLSYEKLATTVLAVAEQLRDAGVVSGDRVVGFLPNIPDAVIAMLAATSLGAIWSSCSPDFGAQGVLDRFGQITPKVCFYSETYRYAGKRIDLTERISELKQKLPSVERWIAVPLVRVESPGATSPKFERLPFNHPLYIMYSSGTTGLPKCMVHGVGGTLLQHHKELRLHTDITPDDRVFYFSTCGWMMWNWLVSCLAVGATIVLYDGAPLPPGDEDILWRMAEAECITVFGTSAKYLALCEKSGIKPRENQDLSALRTILSTGSPLANHSFDYVYEDIKRDVHLASVSGGTDIISCFAGGNPVGPVYRGELQTRALAMAVDVWSDDGQSLCGEPGELVCTKPFPSMPVEFWHDQDGSKYRAAYFDFFPGVWRHGDWSEITSHNGMVIYGRSDATLNPGGVRIGTAEIYRQVEQMPEILESIAIGQDIGNQGDVRVVLFVRLREGVKLDDALQARIRKQVRDNTTPLHVPKVIVQVSDIPRTISGKISELAVRNIVHGKPVKNTDALANPSALELFRDIPALRV
ncbi:MAG: acetoacetate--CoA ligase [Gemmatimonadaceae bacterium]|nr:acetoacetate--CoA ligase [Gemmatimonadaceae bacterium]